MPLSNYATGYFRTTKNVFAFSRVGRERLFTWYEHHARRCALFPPLSSCDPGNKFVRWPQRSPSWWHSTVNVPKAAELYTCKSLISCSANFASISKREDLSHFTVYTYVKSSRRTLFKKSRCTSIHIILSCRSYLSKAGKKRGPRPWGGSLH